MVTSTLESILNWRNLNQSVLDFNAWKDEILTIGGSMSLNIAEDWNLNIKAASNAPRELRSAQIFLWENSKINIGGDWNISRPIKTVQRHGLECESRTGTTTDSEISM